MNHYDAKSYAHTVAVNSAIGAAALLAGVTLSIIGGIPPVHIWIGCALAGVVVYNVVKGFTFVYVTTPGMGERQEAAESVEPEERSEIVTAQGAAQPAGTVPWMTEVDWNGLAEYAKQPDAQFSRAALSPWVNQRIYSPIDNTPSFPTVMCRVGASYRVNNGGSLATYAWSSRAPRVLTAIAQMVGEHNPPTPLVA